ncbi:hypothetical protein ACQ4PT_016377 [Festuca glaucescens]
MQIQVRCGCGEAACPEWAVVEGAYTFTVGYHELAGTRVTLKKPLLVLRKKKNDGQGGPAAPVELDVIGVIRHKILFKDRPKALISSDWDPTGGFARAGGAVHGKEVWETIKDMPSDHTPGPDGFIGAFYQRAWPVIKPDIMACLTKLGVGDGRGFASAALLLFIANTKVTVNGVPGRRIQHTRGLRQGDPTSPMLFVLGMQVLTCLMMKAVEHELLSNLAGISAMQRISIYAYDVVLFFRPAVYELVVIKQLLNIFGEASGLQVNYRKTSATLIRGAAEEEAIIQEILGCQCAAFPIKYLGLQLALRPLTRAQWQPMLD